MQAGWYPCGKCGQMVYQSQNHNCPEKVIEKKAEEIDQEVSLEMTLFDSDLDTYLRSSEGKFQQYLAEKERDEV